MLQKKIVNVLNGLKISWSAPQLMLIQLTSLNFKIANLIKLYFVVRPHHNFTIIPNNYKWAQTNLSRLKRKVFTQYLKFQTNKQFRKGWNWYKIFNFCKYEFGTKTLKTLLKVSFGKKVINLILTNLGFQKFKNFLLTNWEKEEFFCGKIFDNFLKLCN